MNTTSKEVRGVRNEPLSKDQSYAEWTRRAMSDGRLRSSVGQPSDLDFGSLVNGMLTGRWNGHEAERRALAEGTGASGGFLVPTITSAMVIDFARNRARVMQAGATTVPLESDVQIFPRQANDPSTGWYPEAAEQTLDNYPTFEEVVFSSRTLRSLVLVSQELLDDAAVDLANLVTSSIAKATAIQLDEVALRGSGIAPIPTGILNQPGVGTTDLGASPSRTVTDGSTTLASTTVGSATANFTSGDVGRTVTGSDIPAGATIVSVTSATAVVISAAASASGTGETITFGALAGNGRVPLWDDLSISAQAVRLANFEPSGFILSPGVDGELSRSKDNYGRYLGPPPDISGLPRFTTNQVPRTDAQGTSSTASEIYCGEWSQLLIGMRSEIRLMTLTERYRSANQVGFFAYSRWDIQLAHPAAFNVLTGAL